MPFSHRPFDDLGLKPIPIPADGCRGDFNINNQTPVPIVFEFSNTESAYHHHGIENQMTDIQNQYGTSSVLLNLPTAQANSVSFKGFNHSYWKTSMAIGYLQYNDFSTVMSTIRMILSFGINMEPGSIQAKSISYSTSGSTVKYLSFTFYTDVVDGAKTRKMNKIMTTADYGLILDVTPLVDTPISPHLFRALALQLNYWADLGTSFNPTKIDANKVMSNVLNSDLLQEYMELGSLLVGKCGCNTRCLQTNMGGCCNGQCCNWNWACCASQCCNSNNSCACNQNLTCTQFNRKPNFDNNTMVSML